MKSHTLSPLKVKHLMELAKLVKKHRNTMNIDMLVYHQRNEDAKEYIATTKDFECGSTCCAVGYAAHWGIGSDLYEFNMNEMKENRDHFNYPQYSYDIFASTLDKYFIGCAEYSIWDYLFGCFNPDDADVLYNKIMAVVNQDDSAFKSYLKSSNIDELRWQT